MIVIKEFPDRVVNCFQNCILAYNFQPMEFGNTSVQVVNCFQNCILAYNFQLHPYIRCKLKCCELLSKLYFSL